MGAAANCAALIESKHSPQLAAGTIKWGIQRGRASPLVACGVNTPYAKCLIYLFPAVFRRAGQCGDDIESERGPRVNNILVQVTYEYRPELFSVVGKIIDLKFYERTV